MFGRCGWGSSGCGLVDGADGHYECPVAGEFVGCPGAGEYGGAVLDSSAAELEGVATQAELCDDECVVDDDGSVCAC